MVNPAVSTREPLGDVHPSVMMANQEISHPVALHAVIKGTPLLTAAAIATGCAYVGLNNPETQHVFPVCGLYALTGYYCPGCGMTRALHCVLHGNIVRAIQYNALLVAALPVLMYLYVWWMTWAFKGKRLPVFHLSRRTTWIIIGLIAVFIVGRNFPFAVSEYFSRGRVQ